MRRGKNPGTFNRAGEARPLIGPDRGNAAPDNDRAWGRGTGTEWKLFLRRADAALARKDFQAAEAAVHSAFLEAAAHERWEDLLEVGQAYLRIGDVAGARQTMDPEALRAYLAALVTALRQESLDGVIRTAGAYAACGQRETAAKILRVAESMPSTAADGHAGALLRALRDRLGMH